MDTLEDKAGMLHKCVNALSSVLHKDASWFTGVGIGADELILYVDPDKARPPLDSLSSWQGVPVIIREMGPLTALAEGSD